MNAHFTITNYLYKAILKPDYQKPIAIERIVSAKNENPNFIVVIDTYGKASRLICDDSPSLGLNPIFCYRISVESLFATTIYPIGYVMDNNKVKTSDIIFTGKSLEYSGDEIAMAMCEIKIPENTSAGNYNLLVRVYESKGLNDEKLIGEKKIVLTIINTILPSSNEFSFYADFWQHNSNIARTYGVQLWSDKHFELIGKVLKKLKNLGQKSITVVASDCPWRGWGCYLMRDTPANLFEYNIVKVIKDNKSQFLYDFNSLDKLLKLYDDHGITGDITIYGLLGIWRMPYFDTAKVDYPEAIKIRYLDTLDGSYKYIEKKEDIISYIKALFNHLKSLGIWDKVRIGADEPSDVVTFCNNIEVLKEIEQNLKLKIAMDNPEVIKSLGAMCEDICLSFPCTIQSLKTKSYIPGKKLWYVCNVPNRPNSLLHNDLSETVALGVLNSKFLFDGLLRWAFTCWTIDPIADLRYNVNGLPAGDVCLIYPSSNGEIYESQRYKALKFGIILYELLTKIKDDPNYEEMLECVVGKNKDFYMISEDIGISTNIDDYIKLYTTILNKFEGENL